MPKHPRPVTESGQIQDQKDELPLPGASQQKKQRISAGDGKNLQSEFSEVEAQPEKPYFAFEESSVDQGDAQVLSSADREAKQNISQNKNPSLWCVGFGEESSATFWDVSSSKSFDHSVDDPMFWGPYLSERQWGTVREDFSEDENSWEHVSYEDANHHAYVSGEDGLMGVSDKCQLLCASMALWNGKDPFLKERLFGLTGNEGNHGEDVKELYYYLDNVPDHSYMRALYKYPQGAFPYKWLREENKNRGRDAPEFEITDTGVFETDGHWDVTVEYAKTDHLGLACQIEAVNNGRFKQTIHIIPQFWFRHVQRNEPIPRMTQNQPEMRAATDGTIKIKYNFGNWRLIFMQESKQKVTPTLMFTDNVSTPVPEKSCGADEQAFYKDAFHKVVVNGQTNAVNPGNVGTKCGARYEFTVEPGAKVYVHWRLESSTYPMHINLAELKTLFGKKRKDAETYYRAIMPDWTPEERNIGTQAMAGLFWSKQYYMYDVKNWLDDFRHCSENKGRKGRNSSWSHVHNHHILLMPDNWEFPWYAGWDLCVSAVLYSRFSPAFAKNQITTFLSDCYMHPKGQLPGCEFEMGDANPPLQPWAVLRIYYADGANDLGFLRKCFHRLLLNYNWWCNSEFESTNTYGRGFLGMDNISVVDRSGSLPYGWSLVQADFTGWMACYALWMLQIVVELGQTDLVYCDLIPRFLNQFLNIATAMNKPISEKGLWDDEDRFFYDVFHTPHGRIPIRLRSMVGLVPLLACATIKVRKLSTAAVHFNTHLTEHPQHVFRLKDDEVFLSALCLPRVQSVLERVFSEEEFLSPYGIRSLSKVYEENHYSQMVGDQHMSVKYTPGESDSGAFGGNSNWRGPVWVFMNYLLLESFDKYSERAKRSSSRLVLNKPQSSGGTIGPIPGLIKDLEKRLLAIFLPDKEGNRPVHGSVSRYAVDPKWRNLVLFYEFTHADTGRGCGASHQTGWTATIIEIIYRLHSSGTLKPSKMSP